MIIAVFFLMAICSACQKEVIGIQLNTDKVTLHVGGTVLLKATVLPEEAIDIRVSWTSSNSDVAIVSSDGLVYALKEGVSIVTVTTYTRGFSASCVVEVNNDAPIVEPSNPIESDVSIITNPVSSPGSFSAVFSGSVNNSEESTHCGILYGLSPSLSQSNGIMESTVSKSDFSFKVNGLLDDETYYYRAYALINDRYYYGDEKSFHTEPMYYYIGDKQFKMIKVEYGASSYSIMQTELPPKKSFGISGAGSFILDEDMDGVVLKREMRSFLEDIREATGLGLRLPTPEEWVYAAKGGKYSVGYKYCGSNSISDVAWYSGNSSGSAKQVAQKKPNELGLYDMSGNYAEVCAQTTDLMEPNVDGKIYGGCWKDVASGCTATSYIAGSTTGKIKGDTGQTWEEYNAFDGRWAAVRLVFSREIASASMDTPRGDGTLNSPYNAAGAIAYINGSSYNPTARVYVKGKISSIKYYFSAEYGTAAYNISEDGVLSSTQFTCYGIRYLEDKNWKSGYTQIQTGDEVIVYGTVTFYNNSVYETTDKDAYIYSLNGKTKAE